MPQIKHIVLLKFKPETTDAKVEELFAELGRLADKLDGVLDFNWGKNNSQEGLDKGFTHGFVMTFRDDAGRDEYLPHPDHEVIKGKIFAELDGGFDGVHVLDWYG